MSRVFATGSADGIGLETVRQLLAAGHEAVGHARDARRAEDLRTAAPGVREVVVGDLTSLAETKAPAPARLVYLTSGLEADGRLDLDDLSWEHRAWDGMQAYADSKLHDVLLALAVAPLWPGTLAAAVDPGWIRAKLGGPNAWDEVDEDATTPVWLVTSDDDGARVTGEYLKRFEVLAPNPVARDVADQDALLARLAAITGVPFPRP